MSIYSQILTLIANALQKPIDAIAPDIPWEEQDADSLDLVEVLIAVEDHFGIYVPDSVVVELHTPADLAAWLEEHLAEQ